MNLDSYNQFLTSKVVLAEKHGIKIDASLLHESTKPHQRDIIVWALDLGAALIAADCGTGKSHMAIETMRMLYEKIGGKFLIVTELGASETFVNPDPEVGEGARLGVPIDYVTNTQEAFKSNCWLVCTNYERVRNGDINFAAFNGVWLDEGNYIKNLASETTDALHQQLKTVKYKFIATATPSPNETLEIINYAHVLGICDRGQILTRFFQRNSTKAGELTLYEQHEHGFWMWVGSWAVFITKPSDLGYDDEGYELPELEVNWHEVSMDTSLEKVNRDGQKEMFVDGSASLPDAAKVKRASIDVRLNKALDIIFRDGADTNEHFIIWHHLEDERKALNTSLKNKGSYADIYGSMDWRIREQRIVDFTKGDLQILATKPEISGVGCNFQKHCHHAIFLGINHSWNDFYQAMCRLHRFGQLYKVTLDCIHTPEERAIVDNIKRKWKQHNDDREKMRSIVQEFGLGNSKFIEQKKRSVFIERQEWKGENYTLVNNDSVIELYALEDNSIDLITTSIPFGNHYEFTDKLNDFGHNVTNAEFFRQMDFLVPNLLRVLKPGRIAAIHTKNRIHYGSVTGLGFSVMHRFTHAACDCFERNGFQIMGFHYIPTDVVAENNQTYRLTYGELQKDSTKMGAGIPEEIWIFRKPPTSNQNAYADVPVTHNMASCPYCNYTDHVDDFYRDGAQLLDCKKCKQFFPVQELIVSNDKEDYSLAKWQIDADSFWKSSGNRYLQPEELAGMNLSQIRKWWNRFNSTTVYDFEKHVELLKTMDHAGKLSRTFTTLPLRSNTPYVWNDMNRMHGLNMEQSRRKQKNHICPMPFDEVDRLIELYSNQEEMVLDMFGGLGTSGVRALKKKRKAFLIELNDIYAQCAEVYLRETEMKNEIPTLFDLITA